MDKLKQLPVYWQLLIFVGLSALIYYGFYTFVTSDVYTQAASVQEQADALQRKNEQARIATQRIEEFRQMFAQRNAEYEELKVLLPEQREITNVLQGLQEKARIGKLTMIRFTPKDDVPNGFMTAKPVEVEVASNFGSLKLFYEEVAKLQRIVSISDFKIIQRPKQASDKTLDSQFLLTAYYATPESVRLKLEEEKAAKEAKTKPAAPPAAAPPPAK